MIRSALPLSLAAALGLAACGSDPNTMASRDTSPRAAAPTHPALAYRPGSGIVQAVTAAPRTASAGASAGTVSTTRAEPVTSAGASTAGSYQRLAIRMDDGRMQYVDMAGPDVPAPGTRVQLTPDHQIVRQ